MFKIRCSSLPRLAACPGSLNACAGIPSKDSAVSLAGTDGHAVLERYYGARREQLSGSMVPSDFGIENFTDALDSQTASRCRRYACNIDELIASHGGAVQILTEHEMSFPIADGVEITGHADLIVICADGIHLVIDYKFNFLEVERASRNIQIMGYVVLWANECQATREIHGVLIAGGNEIPYTATSYNRETVKKAIQKLTTIVQSAVLRDVRNPGEEQCKYCQAKCTTRCPETLERVSTGSALMVMPENLLPAVKADAAALRSKAKELIKLAESYVERIDAEVRAYPEEWAGQFTLQSTGDKTTVLSVKDVYRILVLEEKVLTDDEFFAGVTFSFPKATEAAADRLSLLGYVKGKIQDALEGMCWAFIQKKPKEKSVKAVSK